MKSIDHLAPALPGERFEFDDSAAGRLNMYAAGEGAPLLLIHSINAAASAAEMRPLQSVYRAARRVFCLELPGFGMSERSDRHYSPRLMTDAVLAACGQIRARCGAAAIDALALSLSCEFLARAATEAPASFRSLAFVSPTGLSGRRELGKAPGTTRGQPWLYRLLRGPKSRPGWARTVYGWLTQPKVIRYFLRRTWGSPDIDVDLWRYDIETARQPGAEYAPLYFLSGELFSADLHSVYRRLVQPVFIAHGVRGDFTNYGQAGMISSRPNCRLSVYPTGALPYFETLDAFCADYDAFLEATA
jgi:pimeloyl-ACP methyl ester carboxylesterase